METTEKTSKKKTFEELITKILLNSYIGFILLIKDVIEFFSWFHNFKKTGINMESSLIINTVIDLFIAFVIYSILKQYKNKLDRKEYEADKKEYEAVKKEYEADKKKYELDKKENEIIRLNQKMFNARIALLIEAHNSIIYNMSLGNDKAYELKNPIKNRLKILRITINDYNMDNRPAFNNFILPSETIIELKGQSDEYMKLYGLNEKEIELIRALKGEETKPKYAEKSV